jgi:hypothetical protein
MGDAQVNQDSPPLPLVLAAESPMARSRNATPSSAPASPLAVRACSVSCAVRTATAAKVMPPRPQPTAIATDPATGSS